jgi:hypothetical protein
VGGIGVTEFPVDWLQAEKIRRPMMVMGRIRFKSVLILLAALR